MMKMKERISRGLALSSSKGFTLIELLVVIAIIGILAAVILASLGTARNKGNDAKVQQQMKAIQTAAEIYYSSNGGRYSTTASTCTELKADTASGAATLFATTNWPNATAPVCQQDANNTVYMAYHAMSSDTTKYWCVDSTGVSRQLTAAPGTAITACP